MEITGKLVDIYTNSIYSATIIFEEGKISDIIKCDKEGDNFILPGFIDSHIHIESAMVTPGSFAGAAVSRGTIATVSDPHEIANVLGVEGVKFMYSDSQKVPLKFCFGAPSCVPATIYETSGASIDHVQIGDLFKAGEAKFLGEMMNYPGVVNQDPEIIKKIETAKIFKKRIDGHAPGLSGEPLARYVSAGISTDHECSTLDEAIEKIGFGMKILIREGSAARNLKELKGLVKLFPEEVMLCSDDLHPEMLAVRHINAIAASLVSEGFDLFDVIRCCSLNPVRHYGLNAGLLKKGDPADFIIVSDLDKMDVTQTWIDGTKVYDHGNVLFDYQGAEPVNKFNSSAVTEEDIRVIATTSKMRVIEAIDGELLTKERIVNVDIGKLICPDTSKDILKLVVKDRYNDSPPATCFISGFGLKKGAFAASVAHDSHNIIGLGTNDKDIVAAINGVIEMKGGLTVSEHGRLWKLPLPVAGIMTDRPVQEVAADYGKLSHLVRSLGCIMAAPFMTLSFMALLVIPSLKLSDKGLFDGRSFSFIPLFA